MKIKTLIISAFCVIMAGCNETDASEENCVVTFTIAQKYTKTNADRTAALRSLAACVDRARKAALAEAIKRMTQSRNDEPQEDTLRKWNIEDDNMGDGNPPCLSCHEIPSRENVIREYEVIIKPAEQKNEPYGPPSAPDNFTGPERFLTEVNKPGVIIPVDIITPKEDKPKIGENH